MCEHQRLTRLIANIYDAALDAKMWNEVLADIADFVDGRVAGLLAKDPTKGVAAHWHANADPHYLQLYAKTYSKLGPVATSPPRDPERISGVADLMPLEEFRRSRFYREWAQPQGWVDVAVAVLDKAGDGTAFLTMSRDESTGMVDDAMRRRMELIVPHVRRAVLIGKSIDFKQAEAATFADLLDGLSAGLFLVDAQGRIVHANSAGNDMLGAGDFLRSSCGRLVAGDAEVDQTLRETAAAAASGDIRIGVKGIAVPLSAHDGERYVAHLLPLSSGARHRAGAAYAASAALFVRKAALACPSRPEVIGKTFNLTPAELRVMLAIVDIGGVPEVAAALGVAETTVKTHLSRLFEKTGAGRQADLVKLVAGFSTPLAV
jgi:DNA-binding CsgD family transcriptional regulator/PAS domain-containing protein